MHSRSLAVADRERKAIMAENSDQGLVSTIGPVKIDWPRTIGYYGGIALAVAFELIEPPLAIFVAAIPLIKMLNHPKLPKQTRFVSHLLDGAAKPVGGDAQATVRLVVPGADDDDS
jgi:hypothetical protein